MERIYRTEGDYREVIVWMTGSGQIVRQTHAEDKCAGDHCAVHRPSDHHMREWPTFLRGGHPMDLSVFTERICPHGVGHPDPDDPFAPAEHGCDGCCKPPAEDAEPEAEHGEGCLCYACRTRKWNEERA